MSLAAAVLGPKDQQIAELSTISESQPLVEEHYLEKASVHLDNRLFVATTGTSASFCPKSELDFIFLVSSNLLSCSHFN